MRRAPLVIGATGVGLGLLFSFHTKPLHVNISAASGGSDLSGSGSAPPTTAGGPGSASTGSTTTGPATTGPTVSSGSGTTVPAPATTAPATKSATGQDFPYRYGDLQLRVTEKGSTITRIQIVSDGASDPRSEEINSQALPLLQQEAMSAQSANIDGVSGATYTSAAYAQALQSALDQLGA